MNKDNLKTVLSWIMYLVGFVVFVAFMDLANGIGNEAWIYAIGASVGVLIFTLSGYLRK